jgi:hypothetical protein
MTWVRPRSELIHQLKIQRRAIKASCSSYDSGETWEALRLSTAVANLVWDSSGGIKCILTQLGVRNDLTYISSGMPCIPGNLVREVVLAGFRIHRDGRNEHVPWLGRSPVPSALVDFDEWWERDTILKEGDDFRMTRRQLVTALRSTDGGSHIDAELRNPNYARFSRETMIHTGTAAAPEPNPLLGAERASMRQIAWELLVTLNSWRPS